MAGKRWWQVVPKGTFRKWGGKAGRALGAAYGHPNLGKWAGAAAGRGLAYITGTGAYRRAGPYQRPRVAKKIVKRAVKTAVRRRITGRGSYGSIMPTRGRPRLSSAGSDPTSIWIDECEYIGDLYSGPASAGSGPTVFTTQQYCINPALATQQGGMFSWLAGVAQSYQQYEFTKLVVEYRPTSGNATGANTSLGQVCMACDYENQSNGNTQQPPFLSKSEMLNSEFGISGDPSTKVYLAIECKKKERANNLYDLRNVDQNALAPQNQALTDINTHDYGMVQIATVGQQTPNQQLGEIWVHYRVRLTKKKYSPPGSDNLIAHYEQNASAAYGQNAVTQMMFGSPLLFRAGKTYDNGTAVGNGYLPAAPTGGGGWSTYSFPITWGPSQIPSMVPSKDNRMTIAMASLGQNVPAGYSHNIIQFPPTLTEGIFRVRVAISGNPDTSVVSTMAQFQQYNCQMIVYDRALLANTVLAPEPGQIESDTMLNGNTVGSELWDMTFQIIGPYAYIDLNTFYGTNFINNITALTVSIVEVDPIDYTSF